MAEQPPKKQKTISAFFSPKPKDDGLSGDNTPEASGCVGSDDPSSQIDEAEPDRCHDPTARTSSVSTGRCLDAAVDIAGFVTKDSIGDDKKAALIHTRQPAKIFKFPPKTYSDKRRPNGMKRYCQHDWFVKYDFICYSKVNIGIYCLCCVLFPMPAHQGKKAKKLITEVYNNWKDASQDLDSHALLQYHQDSMAKMKAFMQTYQNPATRIDTCLSDKIRRTVKNNREILQRMIGCIEHCARQGHALRGHRDDGIPNEDDDTNPGNFKATLLLMAEKDPVLSKHLKTCGRNAGYTSKTSQNKILDCIKSYIQGTIVAEVRNQEVGPYYGLIADEVTDVSNWEQLGIVIRYTKAGKPVERLLEFIKCERITGAAICTKILQVLQTNNLDPMNCRSQTYDGASNMSSDGIGAQTIFQERTGNHRAPYFWCASHRLNLALSRACKVPEIFNMVCAMKSLGMFFKYSPKKQEVLRATIEQLNQTGTQKKICKTKMKPLCETRWVERHTAFTDLVELYDPVLTTLHHIKANTGKHWDSKAMTDAAGSLTQITDSNFLVAFQTSLYVFGYTKSLATLLQGTGLDVVKAFQRCEEVKFELQNVRDNAETEFKPIFSAAIAMAARSDNEIKAPRTCGRQTLRSNVPADDDEIYYRRAIFIPFLDQMLVQLSERFSEIGGIATKAFLLVPAYLGEATDSSMMEVATYYSDDMPCPRNFEHELKFWKSHWSREEHKPTSIPETLSNNSWYKNSYPNVNTILHILLVAAASNASVERANSSIGFVKSDCRSTMTEDRLNALLLIFVHRDMKLDYGKITDMYATRHPRRMALVDPMSSN